MKTRHVPGSATFLYGTAWKEDRTKRLVRNALEAGFRGIDTANQRRHYDEAAVGEALSEAFTSGLVTREQLFLQTKFTHVTGQDHRLPYDPAASLTIQVQQSFKSSLEHLRIEYLDSYVLHGPMSRTGLHAGDIEAWRAMEEIQLSGGTRVLGVSNIGLEQLEELCALATVRPAFVQNRCFARLGWDGEIREYCTENGIRYQAFSLLTANRDVMEHQDLGRLAGRLQRTPAQLVFGFALKVGMVPLTGTSDSNHMREDLGCLDFELKDADADLIERMSLRSR